MWEQLIAAIKDGNAARAEQLINQMNSRELSRVDDRGHTALIDLLEKGFDKLAEVIIPKMTDQAINVFTTSGKNTALIWAAYKGFEQVVKMLIPKMTIGTIDTEAHDKKTALGLATEKNHENIAGIIKFYRLVKLIEAGRSSEAQGLINQIDEHVLSQKVDGNDNTLLHFAVKHRNEKIVKMLTDKMTSEVINSSNNSQQTALHFAVLPVEVTESIVWDLLDKMTPEAVSASNNKGQTALHIAVSNRKAAVAEKLVDKMIPDAINAVSQTTGKTALYNAIERGMEKVAIKLIEIMSSDSINYVDGSNGSTVIHIAAEKKMEGVCKILINKMSSDAINHPNGTGNTALHLAAQNGMDEVCELLISKMSHDAILHKNSKGYTIFNVAKNGAVDLAGILVTKIKLDLKIQDNVQYLNTSLDLLDQAFLHSHNDPSLYFKKGNVLCALGKKTEAIKCYEIALSLDSSYGEKIWDNINFNAEQSTKTTIDLPKFVINTIAYVPDRKDTMEGDSSSEDITDEFSEDQLYYTDGSLPPFRTWTSTLKKGKWVEDEAIGKVIERDIEYKENTATLLPSGIVQPFLDKLVAYGFEEADKDKLENSVSTSIGLNRPKSLSTRKNQVLLDELEANIETSITHQKFGFHWEYNWYDDRGRPENYDKVHRFYKQLKKIDREKAENFRAINERTYDSESKQGTYVPYQALREQVKNHRKTKELVQEFKKQSSDSDIYFSFIDSDTVDFNGIYSAYLRIHKDHTAEYGKSPTVMSTGYEFRSSGEDYPYQVGSQLDRAIRVETAKHIPLGIYYPEPNLCVLLPPPQYHKFSVYNRQHYNTLPESFISQDTKLAKMGNSESVVLLRQVKGRQGATFIFSDDNPLITAIPDRTKDTKQKTKKTFSQQFCSGGKPVISREYDDIAALKFNQSHFDEQNWVQNLYMNRAFQLNTLRNESGNAQQWTTSFVGPAKNFLKGDFLQQDLTFLFQSVGPDIFIKIVAAAQGIRTIIDKFKVTGTVNNNKITRKIEVDDGTEDILTVAIKSGAKLVGQLITQKSKDSPNWQQKLDNAIIKALKIDQVAYDFVKLLQRLTAEVDNVESNQKTSGARSSNYNQASSNSVEIKPSYKCKENKGGGDCAVYAIIDSLKIINHVVMKGRDFYSEDGIMFVRQRICEITKYFFPLYQLATDLERKENENDEQLKQRVDEKDNWLEVRDQYKQIFGQNNFSTFKKVISIYLTNPLSDEDTKPETKDNLNELKEVLSRVDSWENLAPETIKEIFIKNNTLDINIKAIIDDHKLDSDVTPEDYYNHAVGKGIWLSNSEMSAYLLTLGFVIKSGDSSQSGTYITYVNSDDQTLCFYNNGKDTNANQAYGTHWMAAMIQEQLKGIKEYKEEINIGWINSYFGKYTLDGLDNILELRLKDLKLQDIKILKCTFLNQEDNNIFELLSGVVNTKAKTILAPCNLFNKHPVGLIFEKNDNGSVQIKYLDPENKSIPVQLKQILEYYNLNIEQLDIEQQKYSNCGPEVIENFIFYLTGTRYTQEKSIEEHSRLVENNLLNIDNNLQILLLIDQFVNPKVTNFELLQTFNSLSCNYFYEFDEVLGQDSIQQFSVLSF